MDASGQGRSVSQQTMEASASSAATIVATATAGFNTTSTTTSTLSSADIVVVVLYFILTLGIGLWATYSSSRRSVQGYFLAGRNMVWWPVGASLFASNIGTGHFIGLAGTGAASGIGIGSFEWLAPYELILLGWVFLPIYISCEVYTMPEYLRKRYGRQRLRITMSIISMLLYVLTKIAVDLYAGALFIQIALGINLYLAIISLLVVTAIYTVLGGLKAVIYTDTVQTIIMLIGGIMVMIKSFVRIGGYSALEEKYMNAIPQTTVESWTTLNSTTCGMPRDDSFHIVRDPVDSDLPWPGALSGIILLGSWYWCTDQVIVQRTLAADTIQDAKGGCILAGFLKIIPMYIIVMAGMISRVIFPNEVACAEPSECERICQNPAGCSNIAYPKLVLEVLPTGLRGIMVAAMLSALMSSLTSIFNSTSTIFTIDIWKRIRKNATEREQLIVGKVTVVLLVVISILWMPVLLTSAGGQLFIYLQSIQSALGPPIFALYLYGILWPRINEQGAFWGLLTGFSAGLIRLILDFYYKAPACGEPEYRPPFIYKVNYLYVSAIVFTASTVVTVTVSYLTEPPSQRELSATTWKTINKSQDKNKSGPKTDGRLDEVAFSHVRVELRLQDGQQDGHETQPEEEHETRVNNDENNPEADITQNQQQQAEHPADDENSRLHSLYEHPTKAFWLNMGALCLLLVATFLLGYYA